MAIISVLVYTLHRMINAFCRVIGPEMPSAELLAAAAKLTEAEAELRYLLKRSHQIGAILVTIFYIHLTKTQGCLVLYFLFLVGLLVFC